MKSLLQQGLHIRSVLLMQLLSAVLDDGLLDVSYVMNYPGEQVPTLLRELMRGREESDPLELMDCFGSMRVKWLEVHCADGLQASTSLHCHDVASKAAGTCA